MVKIEFLGPINREGIELDVKNLNELSEKLKEDSELSIWLSKSAVAVNDELVFNREFNLKDGDRVSLLPPVCGG
jgi:molybdopterin synthase sulfur carrier subunit